MKENSVVKPGDWITIGENFIPAVVCTVYEDGQLEVVYLSRKKEAINEDVNWIDERWEFTSSSGGYAGDYSRLSEYVSILRAGRL